jgi:hypothetical protein
MSCPVCGGALTAFDRFDSENVRHCDKVVIHNDGIPHYHHYDSTNFTSIHDPPFVFFHNKSSGRIQAYRYPLQLLSEASCQDLDLVSTYRRYKKLKAFI